MVFTVVTAVPVALAEDDNDKVYHFAISSVLGFGAETFLHTKTDFNAIQRVYLSTALATIPGLIKEFIDDAEDDNEFDNDDMVANVAGAFTGAFVGNYLNESVFVAFRRTPEKAIFVTWVREF